MSTTGDCASDVKFFCKTVKPGEGRIAACLTNEQDQEENGAVTGRKISPQCAEELRAFKIDRRAPHPAPLPPSRARGAPPPAPTRRGATGRDAPRGAQR